MMSATTLSPPAAAPPEVSTIFSMASRRIGAGAGVAFALSIVVGFLLPAPPDGAPSGRELTDFFSQHRSGLLLAGYLNALAMVFFLCFAGILCAALRRGGRELSSLADLAFGAETALFVSTLVIGGLTQGLISIVVTSLVMAGARDESWTPVPTSSSRQGSVADA
jgi:hypothetical protein